MQENLADAEAGSVLECLEPRPRSSSDGEAASRVKSCAAGGEGGNGGSAERRAQGESGFRTHTCWVKAGHDVLHERKPFLLALLQKVGTEKA